MQHARVRQQGQGWLVPDAFAGAHEPRAEQICDCGAAHHAAQMAPAARAHPRRRRCERVRVRWGWWLGGGAVQINDMIQASTPMVCHTMPCLMRHQQSQQPYMLPLGLRMHGCNLMQPQQSQHARMDACIHGACRCAQPALQQCLHTAQACPPQGRSGTGPPNPSWAHQLSMRLFIMLYATLIARVMPRL